jgi:membrane protein Man1
MAENSVNNNENLNSLSNDLIRKRLEEEFGFDCGPITQSTRSVYLKKLKQLINERNKDINETNHQNNSNNDNNDLNATNDDFNSNNTTQTMRLSTLRTPSQRNSPRRKLEEEFGATKTSTPKNRRQSSNPMSSQSKTAANPKSGRKSIPVMSSPRIDANSHLSLTNYSSESSENEEVVEEELLLTIRKSPRKKPSTPPSRPLQEQLSSQRVPFARPYPPPPLKPMTTAVKPTTFSPLTRPPLRRSILSSGQDSAKLANYSDSEADTEHEQNDTIRERLLRHRPGLNINSIITTSKPSQSSTAVGFEDSNSYSNLISFAILALLVLFFVFIFSFYFYTRINSFPKSAVDLTDFHFIDEELVAPICQSDSAKDVFSDVSDNCLKYKSDIMPALTIVKEIKTFVDKTQLNYYCGPNDKKPILTDPKFYQIKDLKTAIMKGNIIINTNREGIKEGEDDIVIFNRDFINALTLIQLNPNWQLVCVKDSLGEIVKIGLSDDYPLNLPFGCHSMLLLNQYLWHILTAFMVIILGSVTYSYLKRSKRIRNEEQDLVYDLVEKSLELLQSPDNPTSMPVLHIRDTLLSPSERKSSKYKRIWNNVVKHIETVESRVKVEIENIEGDDYKTWKWVATNTGNSDGQVSSASTIIRTGGIEWQGQAFAADNNLNVSQTVSNSNNGGLASKSNFMAPTVFLKIRNMFDKETKLSDPLKWKTNIRNAVLEKTMKASKTGTHGIVHLEIEEDSNEGLVYLKCNSVQSATDTYNALHGWWCQKKLVSVKFLKSERYYQRFPDSANSSTPLALENK